MTVNSKGDLTHGRRILEQRYNNLRQRLALIPQGDCIKLLAVELDLDDSTFTGRCADDKARLDERLQPPTDAVVGRAVLEQNNEFVKSVVVVVGSFNPPSTSPSIASKVESPVGTPHETAMTANP